jgi:hypothetical protein
MRGVNEGVEIDIEIDKLSQLRYYIATHTAG